MSGPWLPVMKAMFQAKTGKTTTMSEVYKDAKDLKRETKEIIKANKDMFNEIKQANRDNGERMEGQLQIFTRMLGNEIFKGLKEFSETMKKNDATEINDKEKTVKKDPLSITYNENKHNTIFNTQEQQTQQTQSPTQSLQGGQQTLISQNTKTTSQTQQSLQYETQQHETQQSLNLHLTPTQTHRGKGKVLSPGQSHH